MANSNREYHFWVYILSSRSRTLYVGITNKLLTRTSQHKEHRTGTFTACYNIDRLVYFQYFRYVCNAIVREKELKRYTRKQKIELIERTNPTWEDLYDEIRRPFVQPEGQQILCKDDKQERQGQQQRLTLAWI